LVVAAEVSEKDGRAPGFAFRGGQDVTLIDASARGRANNFDFIRFVLATMVIHSHCWQVLSGRANTDPIGRYLHGQNSGGGVAVAFFFALSGFLVVKSWQQSRTVGDFLRKRALRIYPALTAVCVLCVFIVGPLGGADLHTYFRSLHTYFFFGWLALHACITLPGVFTNLPTPWVDSPLWTIPYEMLCYASVVLLGGLGVVRRRGMVLSVLLALYAFINLRPHWDRSIHYFGSLTPMPPLMSYFWSGAVVYLYRDVIPRSRWLLVLCLGLLAASRLINLNLVLPLCGTYCLFYLAFSRTFRLHGFGRWGDCSYGLYLYAWPIQQLLAQRLGTSIHPLTLFAATMPLAWIVAMLSWHFLERPCLSLKPKPAAPLPETVEEPRASAAEAV
jgi:peptidoglycan/LPS O-acetylase OafA/YrhL